MEYGKNNQLVAMGISPLLHYLDLETASMRVNAVVASIGLVSVNVITGHRVGMMFAPVDVNSQPGRHVDAETVEWWQNRDITSQEAFELAFSNPICTLNEGLILMNQHIDAMEAALGQGGLVNVVGNGPEFDNAIIINALEEAKIKPAWRFRGNQSARTFLWMGCAAGHNEKFDGDRGGIKHHALDDALWEAHSSQTELHLVRPDLFGPSAVLAGVWGNA